MEKKTINIPLNKKEEVSCNSERGEFHVFSEFQEMMLNRQVPNEVIETRQSAGQNLSYVTGSYVRDQLNIIFNHDWNSTILDTFVVQTAPDKKGNTGHVVHAKVRLEIPIYREDGTIERFITKEAVGSKILVGGPTAQEHAYKAATTDALKKAAADLGIGASLYRNQAETVQNMQDKIEKNWREESRENLAIIQSKLNNKEIEEKIREVTGISDLTLGDITPEIAEKILATLDSGE